MELSLHHRNEKYLSVFHIIKNLRPHFLVEVKSLICHPVTTMIEVSIQYEMYLPFEMVA
jgi:hypothetical protein